MDGLIEQLKQTAIAIEKRREDLKEAGYNVGRAIRILEDGDDLVRVEIQEQKLERSGRGLVTEKLEPSETEDQLPKVEKIPPMPPVEEPLEEEPVPKLEPSETRPTSQQMPKGPTRYRNVSTRTAILDALDNCPEPAPATEIHELLVAGGWQCSSSNGLASVRAALSAMRFDDISQKKIQLGPRKITHYFLPSMEAMSR